MISDANKGIINITYNELNLPLVIEMKDNNRIEYEYDAIGSKRRQSEITNGKLYKTTDFVGNFVYDRNKPAWHTFDEGRVIYEPDSTYFAETYIKDHLGNIRVAYGNDGVKDGIRQVNAYYPFGMNIQELSANSSSVVHRNEYLYNGKMMQDELGLDWLDYGARMYDAKIGRWNSQDPLSEIYEKWSLYVYALDNPIRYLDIDGMYSTEEWMKDNGVTDEDIITIYKAPTDNKPKNNLSFETLWDNYPTSGIQHINSTTGYDLFPDHCAINVSEALIRSGMSLDDFKGQKCWGNCPSGENSHALRAVELAKYLIKIKQLPYVRLSGENYEEYISGKTGIIYFEDYWQRSTDKGNSRTGDHIDLWNKNELASIGLVLTFIRQTFSEISETFLDMSDLKRSKQIYFFEINN